MKKLILSPSIYSADYAWIGDEILRLQRAGADMIHIDVMDGVFVPNISVGPPFIKKLRRVTELPFDVHLMISQPEPLFEAFADAGADILTVHAECCPHLDRTLSRIRELGMAPSVALNPHTPVENLRWVINSVRMVLVMTVNPGFGGQVFIENMYDKIKAVKDMAEAVGSPAHIEVDGGINAENVAKVVRAGANVIVAGNAVFRAGDMKAELESYRAAALEAT